METDITLVFLKYLIKYNRIDIQYLDTLEENRFPGSNIHKLITHLCVNYMNLQSDILNEDLKTSLRVYRNTLVHCEGSISSQNIKYGIINILEDIDLLDNVDEYSKCNYMMY